MKAIYQSRQQYLQIPKGDVNRRVDVLGQTFNGSVYISTGETVGVAVVNETASQDLEFYVFCDGENHNRITLTDSKEIENMRKYIEWRHDGSNPLIKEISFEE